MDYTQIILGFLGLIGIIIPAYWGYLENKKNRKKDLRILQLEEELEKNQQVLIECDLRSQIVERLLDISLLSQIREAVDVIFEETKATRFLILIAMNGTIDFRTVSVIFEQHKGKSKINAIARYRNLSIDDSYRQMLKKAEKNGVLDITVDQMDNEALLKQIYIMEGVRYSRIRHLLREPIDHNNDVVVFSSLATHIDEPFTLTEKMVSLTQFDSTIIPALRMMINPIIERE